MILLAQSITVHMPLLMATSAFGLGRKCWSSPQHLDFTEAREGWQWHQLGLLQVCT